MSEPGAGSGVYMFICAQVQLASTDRIRIGQGLNLLNFRSTEISPSNELLVGFYHN